MRIHDWRLGERKIEIRLQGRLAAFSATVIPAKAGMTWLRVSVIVTRESGINRQSAIENRQSDER
jgi:hypothetical protein